MDSLVHNSETKRLWSIMKKNKDLVLHSIMCGIGGFMAGYAVLCRGNLGSAQTVNMVDIVLGIVGKNREELLLRIIGLFLYILGIVFVVMLSKKTKVNMQRYSIVVDMAGFLVLIMIPEQIDKVMGILPMFFMLSTQWSVFHGERGYNSSSVFSTNNLRQLVLAFTEYSLDKDKKQLHKALYYAVTLFCFHISVAISYFAVKYFGIYACLIGFAYAVPAFFVTFIKEEKEQVNATLEAFR